MDVGIVAGLHPGHGIQRQPVAQRGITGNQVAALIAQEPGPGLPAGAGGVAANGQHVAHGPFQAVLKHARQPRALLRILQVGVEGIDVAWQPPFAPQIIKGVFVGRQDVRRHEPETRRDQTQETLCRSGGHIVVDGLIGQQVGIGPDGLAVLAPEAVERPARQGLPGIPLALAEMRQARGCIAVAQPVVEVRGQVALVFAQRRGVPLRSVRIINRHEGGLATHRESHVEGRELVVDFMTEALDLRPLRLAVRQGDARGFPDTLDPHVVLELDLRVLDHS